jgi:hypothetical protein
MLGDLRAGGSKVLGWDAAKWSNAWIVWIRSVSAYPE